MVAQQLPRYSTGMCFSASKHASRVQLCIPHGNTCFQQARPQLDGPLYNNRLSCEKGLGFRQRGWYTQHRDVFFVPVFVVYRRSEMCSCRPERVNVDRIPIRTIDTSPPS
jgi:hypothetical protein